MIFVTVGTQIPFDRLIQIIDELAPELGEEIIAQTSPSATYSPKNIQTDDFLPPEEFNRIFERARLVVAHAGMGTIISAMQSGKPLIVFPRQASLGEHRNEHQLATVRQLEASSMAAVAYDREQLRSLLLSGKEPVPHKIAERPSESLSRSIKDYIR